MHSDLAGIEVDGRPLKTTNLAPSDPGREFKQEERCEPVALHRHQEGLDLVRPPHHAPLPRTFGWFDVAGRVVCDVPPGDGINERPVDHRMDVAHRFGCQATGHLLGNDAGSVPPNRCSCGVDCRLTCVGNLTSRGVFTLGDPIRPVGVHLAVAVALDASFREQLPIKLQQLGFIEVLKALAADPGNDVRLGVVLPVLPRCGIDRRFDSREPLGKELGDCASRGPDDAAAVGFAHRFPAGSPCLFLRDEAALADPRVIAGRRIPFGAAEAVRPCLTALVDSAFHATNSRSPAVTT